MDAIFRTAPTPESSTSYSTGKRHCSRANNRMCTARRAATSLFAPWGVQHTIFTQQSGLRGDDSRTKPLMLFFVSADVRAALNETRRCSRSSCADSQERPRNGCASIGGEGLDATSFMARLFCKLGCGHNVLERWNVADEHKMIGAQFAHAPLWAAAICSLSEIK